MGWWTWPLKHMVTHSKIVFLTDRFKNGIFDYLKKVNTFEAVSVVIYLFCLVCSFIRCSFAVFTALTWQYSEMLPPRGQIMTVQPLVTWLRASLLSAWNGPFRFGPSGAASSVARVGGHDWPVSSFPHLPFILFLVFSQGLHYWCLIFCVGVYFGFCSSYFLVDY